MMQGLVMVLQKYFLNSTFAITTNPNYRAVQTVRKVWTTQSNSPVNSWLCFKHKESATENNYLLLQAKVKM